MRHPGSVEQPRTVTDLVSLMDIGPTILEAAGLTPPTHLEGRSLLPYLHGQAVQPREFVFCEDNYQIMMRSQTHKLVYYIGQEAGELYDLHADPHELHNLWGEPAHAEQKGRLLQQLLNWLAASTYWNAGYKQGQTHPYALRWPGDGDADLHGGNARARPAGVVF
jgi:arylsulfatase A-like enzyme